MQKPEQILLGQPAEYPTKLVEALKQAFSQRPTVRAAYLAHCLIPSQGTAPHTAVGLDADDYDSLVVELGPVVTSALAENQILDFISVRDGGAIAEYMLKETTPFHGEGRTQAKRGFWQRLFGR